VFYILWKNVIPAAQGMRSLNKFIEIIISYRYMIMKKTMVSKRFKKITSKIAFIRDQDCFSIETINIFEYFAYRHQKNKILTVQMSVNKVFLSRISPDPFRVTENIANTLSILFVRSTLSLQRRDNITHKGTSSLDATCVTCYCNSVRCSFALLHSHVAPLVCNMLQVII
jgi:hypothetical protein